jgi:hypothetical protein
VTAPSRRTPSVRRTTVHDSTRPHGLDGPVLVTARGLDLRIATDGTAVAVGTAAVALEAAFTDGTIASIVTSPHEDALAALVGHTAYSGFRRAVDDALPHERASHSVRYQLLDDVPIALMLSGRVPRAHGIGLARDPNRPRPVDICAGWVGGGTLLAGFTEFGPPLHTGPAVVDDDGLDPLPPDATRRYRRLDVWREGGTGQVECFFRDSHADAAAVETVVHQYAVHSTIDHESHEVVACTATAGPLPYPECPGATASAERLRGEAVDQLRRFVPAHLVGPTTCTHLNDTLRSLADAGALLDMLGP